MISIARKTFMKANILEKMMELLQKLVLQTENSAFSRNKNLQNLLILTTNKLDTGRVDEYIKRLDS